MKIPQLTHLQFLVLTQLLRGVTRGRDLRGQLARSGVHQSSPAFYQMMALLEDSGFVKGRYEQQVVNGQIIRERHYQVQSPGQKVWRESRDFYARLTAKGRPGLASVASSG